jgi:hypothetical protein
MLRRRLATVLGTWAALFLGGCGLASCGGDVDAGTTESTGAQPTLSTTTDETPTQPTTEGAQPTVVRVRVVGGVPRDGIVRTTVKKGDRVVLVVTSDLADHVHLHGYDVMRAVAADEAARIRFRATLPGRFEVELEDRGVQVAELTVEP